ncbi:hypothetical protein [Streptococcus caballi]|uniref:hypothetical protein n=1 Tax=Streptococcus caballi TaxID=439220 RepID=UPI00035CD86C|nr:hypothetical protein [Streptococcus caballi]
MTKSLDYKKGYRDAIQFAISEINELVEEFIIDEKVADKLTKNLKTITGKVLSND